MLKMCSILFGCLSILATSCVTPAPTEHLYKFDEEKAFRTYLNSYDQEYKNAKTRLKFYQLKIFALEKAKRSTWCLEQMVNETAHLIDDTALIDKINQQWALMDAELQRPVERSMIEDQGEDGNWGSCYSEVFLKLNATAERVIDFKNQGKVPLRPVTILDRFNSPDRLQAYLDSLLISDIGSSGVSHARELNEVISEFLRLIPRNYPSNYKYHPRLRETLAMFISKWQNPETGWWGPWYFDQGTIVKTDHLSMTFHVVSYTKGQVQRWPEIMKHLLNCRYEIYPYGWKTASGEISNHHMYDVARIYRMGWTYLKDEERKDARAQLREMLHLSLTRTMATDGSFKPDRYVSLNEAFYFGVSFLVEVGFFDREHRFWTSDEFSEADPIRKKLIEHLHQMNGDDVKECLSKLGVG